MKKIIFISILAFCLVSDSGILMNRRKAFRDAYGGNDAYTVLLLDCDSDFTDSSVGAGDTHTPTVTNATIDTGTKKWGAGSGSFNGTNAYVSYPDSSDWNLGTVFTIDFWLKSSSGTKIDPIVIYGTDTIRYTMNNNLGAPGVVGLGVLVGSAGWVYTGSSGDFTDGKWHHIALVLTGGTVTLYIDGTSRDTGSVSSIDASGGTFEIGRETGGPGNYFNGYLDELRISKGIARDPADFPPTQAYTTE